MRWQSTRRKGQPGSYVTRRVSITGRCFGGDTVVGCYQRPTSKQPRRLNNGNCAHSVGGAFELTKHLPLRKWELRAEDARMPGASEDWRAIHLPAGLFMDVYTWPDSKRLIAMKRRDESLHQNHYDVFGCRI